MSQLMAHSGSLRVRTTSRLLSEYGGGSCGVCGVSVLARHSCRAFFTILLTVRGYRRRRAGTLAEGSGMGLYVVKQIVAAHPGRIDVRSEPGHGTTFRVELPPAPAAQPA